jgi:hypothetical protein
LVLGQRDQKIPNANYSAPVGWYACGFNGNYLGSRMALSWLVLLKTVPWTDVISAAPEVVGGAQKLWNAVANRSAPLNAQLTSAAGQETIASLSARLATSEAAIADLHSQVLSASEIIASLARQNASLIARIDVTRGQLAWLAAATIATSGLAAISLFVVFSRS